MNQFKKVSFYTLGCKLNFSETSTIARLFEDAGFAKVEFEETPDVYVINTCSVTENADKKCKQLVKRAQKINPENVEKRLKTNMTSMLAICSILSRDHMLSLVYGTFDDTIADKIITFLEHPTARMLKENFENKEVLKFDP